MGRQGPCSQVSIVLREADALEESLPVIETLSCHPEALGLRGVSLYHRKGLARHTQCLPHIGAQPNLVKQLCQDVEFPLYLGCLY